MKSGFQTGRGGQHSFGDLKIQIPAAQKAEHYEIATYGTLATFARTLGENQVADLLHQTLEEEKEADDVLTSIAESFVNEQALQDAS